MHYISPDADSDGSPFGWFGDTLLPVGNPPPGGERTLWVAIIENAIRDVAAPAGVCGVYKKQVMRQALEWLTGDSQDFKIVCHYAGLNWQYVGEKMRKRFSR